MSLIGKYNEHDLNFTAYEKHRHSEVGDQIIFLGGSGSFTFQVDDGVTNQVRAGISFKMPEGQSFSNITFNEIAGATGNILFAIASGNVVDARSVISGETPILNAASPNDSLAVNLSATDVGLLAHLAGIKSPRNGAFLRPSLIDLTNATHTTTVNTNTTVVTAAANTAGVILHHAVCYGSQSENCYVSGNSSDNILLGWSGTSGTERISVTLPRSIFIPAGREVHAVSSSTYSRVSTYHEVL